MTKLLVALVLFAVAHLLFAVCEIRTRKKQKPNDVIYHVHKFENRTTETITIVLEFRWRWIKLVFKANSSLLKVDKLLFEILKAIADSFPK